MKKTIWFLTLFAIGIYLFLGQAEKVELNSTNDVMSELNTHEDHQLNNAPIEKVEPKSTANKPDALILRNQDVRDWQRERFGTYDLRLAQLDYKNYDLETLEQLGEQGDMIAFDLLGYKYMMQHKLEKAIDSYHRSAVLGSTASLVFISFLKADKVDKSIPFSREREIFVYLQASYLRGNVESLNEAKGFFDLKKIQFSEDDKQYIQQNGIKVYNQLIADRKKLGLLDFDSSIPDFMIDYNKQVENEHSHLGLTTGDSPLFITDRGKKL